MSRRMWRGIWGMVVAGAAIAAPVRAEESQGPFKVTPRIIESNGLSYAALHFDFPAQHVLYADKLSFAWSEADGSSRPANFLLPQPEVVHDKFSGADKKVYRAPFAALGTLSRPLREPATLCVHFQGCDEANCFFPEEQKFLISPEGAITVLAEDDSQAADASRTETWRQLAAGFTLGAQSSGYLKEGEFLSFLDKAASAPAAQEAPPAAGRGAWGLLLALGLIVLGGVALNLTPCVLPMIPINIAILGAGAQAGSRRRGFALGATYAAGMAIAYGVLGLAVVLTGSKFGTLNSSPWFNLAIAVIFLVLALGMFDVFTIDLSRLQGRTGGGETGSRGKFLAAYSMGTVAALLAGACVAPVVISVLLQATTLYNQGLVAGLFLPFLLGLGMGLPWPFAGAGLSFLPKPGRWMARVKYAFGVFIVLFAAYYGFLSASLFRSVDGTITASAKGVSGPVEQGSGPPGSLTAQLAAGLAEARAAGRPVFIDFWASWCKNCSAMEHTTFQSAAVKARLAGYHVLRLQAERPNQPPAREVLDYFKVLGLPSFVVLIPDSAATNQARPREMASSAQAR